MTQTDITVGTQVPVLTSIPCSTYELHSAAKFQKVILNRKMVRFPSVLSSLLGLSTHLLVPHGSPQREPVATQLSEQATGV